MILVETLSNVALQHFIRYVWFAIPKASPNVFIIDNASVQ